MTFDEAGAFGVVTVCALCENPIPDPAENAAVLPTAAAGTKYLCPSCVLRVQLLAGRTYGLGAGLRAGSAPADGTERKEGTADGGEGASAKDATDRVAPPPQLLVDERGELEVAVGGADPVPLASWVDARAQRDKEGSEAGSETPHIRGSGQPPGGAANGGVNHGR